MVVSRGGIEPPTGGLRVHSTYFTKIRLCHLVVKNGRIIEHTDEKCNEIRKPLVPQFPLAEPAHPSP